MTYYTIVQHSGASNDPTFAQGLESASVSTKVERARVARAGGLIFPNYSEAEAYAEREEYPESAQGLVPNAPGTFSSETVNGLRIYVPVSE